jgi:hypothetical protein
MIPPRFAMFSGRKLDRHPLPLEPVVGAVNRNHVSERRPRDQLQMQRNVIHLSIVLLDRRLDQHFAHFRVWFAAGGGH